MQKIQDNPDLHTRLIAVALLVIVLLAFGVRSIPYQRCFQNGEVFLYGQDTYYHFMRIREAAENGLRIAETDPFAGFPKGFQPFWPPYFAQAVALLGLAIGGGTADEALLLRVSAWVPPVVGALTVLPIFWIGSLIFGKRLGLLAALVFALLPGHAMTALVGRIDHHIAEVLFPFCHYALYLQSRQKVFSSSTGSAFRYALSSGLLLALSYWMWPGATLYLGVTIAHHFTAVLFASGRDMAAKHNRCFIGMLIAALVFLIPVCASSYWGKRWEIHFDALSWFQPMFIALWLGYALYLQGVVLGNKVSAGEAAETGIARRLGLGVGLPVVLGLVLLVLIPQVAQSVWQGIGYLTRSDPWLHNVTEAHPLFFPHGIFTRFWAEALLSYGLYGVPLVLVLTAWGVGKGTLLECRDRLFLLIFTILGVLITLGQNRFTYYSAAPVSVCIGWMTLAVFHFVSRTLKTTGTSQRWTIGFSCLAALVVLVLLLYPALLELRRIPGRYIVTPKDIRLALLWLRENSPEVHPEKPEYGVLSSSWTFGHWVQYYAARPTLNNGFHRNQYGNTEAIRLLFAESERDALEILERNQIRYLFLSDISMNLPGYAMILGIPAEPYIQVVHRDQRLLYQPGLHYTELFFSRLYLFDGLVSERGQQPLRAQQLRLIYESSTRLDVFGYPASVVRIFERVPGARITGRGQPGAEVEVRQEVITNQGRRFTYRQAAQVNSTGQFQLKVPYSMALEGGTGFVAAPVLRQGGKSHSVLISEADVLEGRIIFVEWE